MHLLGHFLISLLLFLSGSAFFDSLNVRLEHPSVSAEGVICNGAMQFASFLPVSLLLFPLLIPFHAP
jgi:hypothetical protein